MRFIKVTKKESTYDVYNGGGRIGRLAKIYLLNPCSPQEKTAWHFIPENELVKKLAGEIYHPVEFRTRQEAMNHLKAL